MESARVRREELDQLERERVEKNFEEKLLRRSENRSNAKTHNDRMKIWLTCTWFFRGLQMMGKTVLEARQLKANDKDKYVPLHEGKTFTFV